MEIQKRHTLTYLLIGSILLSFALVLINKALEKQTDKWMPPVPKEEQPVLNQNLIYKTNTLKPEAAHISIGEPVMISSSQEKGPEDEPKNKAIQAPSGM